MTTISIRTKHRLLALAGMAMLVGLVACGPEQNEPVEVLTYMTEVIPPCSAVTGSTADPCEVRTDFGFQGFSMGSNVLPDKPPTYQEILMNSYGKYPPDEIPESLLGASTHLVVRGAFKPGSTRCASHPFLFSAWTLGESALRSGPLTGGLSAFGLGFHHWSCFSTLNVREYVTGSGPSEIVVQHANSSVPYDASDASSNEGFEEASENAKSGFADAFEGVEWVVWLGTPFNASVESLAAYAYWDVQKGEDGVVRVVSPDAEYYEQYPDPNSSSDHLSASIDDFRRDIKAAHESRIELTSGRVGVGVDTPMLVVDVFKLTDYYEELGAYDNPLVTPAPPPPE